MTFFTEIEDKQIKTKTPTIYIEEQKPLESQSNPEQKINTGEITIPDFKLYSRFYL